MGRQLRIEGLDYAVSFLSAFAVKRRGDDMEYEKVKYLDEERVKLWAELRDTQAQLQRLQNALSGDVDAERRGLLSMAAKFGRAYGRLNSRDKESEKLLGSITSKSSKIEEIIKNADALNQKADAIKGELEANDTKINETIDKTEGLISDFSAKYKTILEKLESCQDTLTKLEDTQRKTQEKLTEISKMVDSSTGEVDDINKLHSQLFGYEKDDGTIVEGKKKRLEDVYGDLEQRATDMQSTMLKFQTEYKQTCQETIDQSKTELNAVKATLEGLLPAGLTAGLSSAYAKNRDMEEQAHAKSFLTFVICIIGMIVLAIIPVSVNFYLWGHGQRDVLEILSKLPREIVCILPLYVPLLWLAFFANKRTNLSKRLIEEYKHKEAVSKTYEGLAKQIDKLEDKKSSSELRARLLYNTVMLSEKNPGELIKNFNRPDNPLLDVLNEGSRFSEAIERLAAIPGVDKIFKTVAKKKQELSSAMDDATSADD